MPKSAKSSNTFHIFSREHDSKHYRVWRSDWAPDQFQIVDFEQMDQIISVCKILSIPYDIISDEA